MPAATTARKLAPPLRAVEPSVEADAATDPGPASFAGGEDAARGAVDVARDVVGRWRPTDEPATGVRLSLLHGFDLTVDGAAVDLPWNAQRLLAFLALNPRPLLRLHVAGSLWLDKNEERAGANLRSALWRLRQSHDLLVETRGGHLQLSDDIAVDVRSAEALCRDILAEGGAGAEIVWADRLTGELLPDWYDDWVVLSRERLRQLFLHALERLCLRLCDAGRIAHGIDVGMRAVAVDPLRESAHRAVIAAYLSEGNQSEALRQYDRYRDLLAEQLQLEPSERMTALVRPLAQAR